MMDILLTVNSIDMYLDYHAFDYSLNNWSSSGFIVSFIYMY